MLKRVKFYDILKISLKFIEFSLVVKRSQVSKNNRFAKDLV